MVRRVLLAVAMTLFALPVSGSLLESTSGGLVTYQYDGDTFHDAPDTCAEVLAANETFAIPLDGSVDGIVVPVEDEVDHYLLTITPAEVGDRIFVSVSAPMADIEMGLEVQVPGCGTSVTAPENQPTPESERPVHPAPSAGQKQVAPASLKDGSPNACGGGDWRFLLNQFGDLAAPDSIHGIWTDGTSQEIPRLRSTDATMVVYATTYNSGIRLASVIANVPVTWDGRFNSVHGPCGAIDGGAGDDVYGDPSTATQTSVSFTPITAGDHVVSIRLLPPEAPAAPSVGPQPRSCHYCVGGGDVVAKSASYVASSTNFAA